MSTDIGPLYFFYELLALIVAAGAFHTLVALLRFNTQCRDRPSLQTSQGNWLTSLFAIPIITLVDSLQRLVDFRNQLALPVSSSKFQ